jgi:hypothetical protein
LLAVFKLGAHGRSFYTFYVTVPAIVAADNSGGGATRTGCLLTESEICSLFDHARKKLMSISQLQERKKQVISGLASELEKGTEIPLWNISAEIVRQLKGLVSPRFVRQCLPEKYKQAYRVENAKAQGKKIKNPAAVAPLNKQLMLIFRKKQLEDILHYSRDEEFACAFVRLRPEGEHLAVEVISPSDSMSGDENIMLRCTFARWKLTRQPMMIHGRLGT